MGKRIDQLALHSFTHRVVGVTISPLHVSVWATNEITAVS